MILEIKNPKAPGAKFTSFTLAIFMKAYELSITRKDKYDTYSDIQKEFEYLTLDVEKGKNTTKAKNIRIVFPFLRYCGLINYDENIYYNSFITDLGQILVQTLKMKKKVLEERDSEEIKKLISKNEKLIYQECLKNIIKSDSNYGENIIFITKFLLKYESIDMNEFALILFFYQNGKNFLNDIEFNQLILRYRNNELELNIKIKKEKTITFTDNEVDSQIASYTYFMDIMVSAGIVIKSDERNNFYRLLGNGNKIINKILEDK